MGSYKTGQYRATATVSTGDKWNDIPKIYDSDVNSYAYRKSYSTSATHINGFGINDLPANAVVDSVEIHSKLYASNSYGYLMVYMYTDEGSTSIMSTKVIDGASFSADYVTHKYTAAEIKSVLDSKGVCNGDILQFLKTLRVRFVIGCTKTTALYSTECRVYDNYVVVNYHIPDITYTYVNYDGTVLKTQTVEEGASPTAPSNPTRPETAEYTYTFSGWSLSGTTYTAQYKATKREYTVRWYNEDGKLLETDSTKYGVMPTYDGATPTKAATAQYTYTFKGWHIEVATVTGAIDYYARYTETTNKYTLVTEATEGGTVTAGGSYDYGTSVTLTVTPNNGYKFVAWSDGNTNAIRTVTVTGDATYTAIFEPIHYYVTYDSILNFQKWKDNGIFASNAVVSNISNIGFTLTSNDSVSEGTASSPFFEVKAGESYKIDIDIIGSNWDIYVFFCDADGNWVDFADGPTNRFSYNTNWGNTFTAPNKDNVVKAQIRCDANGSGNTVLFNNFRIYPAEYDYMSNTILAEDRSNLTSWDMPTPVREGYTFIGWNTKPDGSGAFYNTESAYPSTDTVLYSQWEAVVPPSISSVQITPNPCNAGQGLVIYVTVN